MTVHVSDSFSVCKFRIPLLEREQHTQEDVRLMADRKRASLEIHETMGTILKRPLNERKSSKL